MSALHQLEDGVDGTGHHIGVVAASVVGETEEVAPCNNGQTQGFLKPIMAGDGPHGEVVGDHHPVETKLVAEQFFDDDGGEGGGKVVAEVAVDDMCHHHHVDNSFVDKGAVRLQLCFFPGIGYVDKTGVGVAGGTAVSGEVFQAADDLLFVQLVEPYRGASGDGGGVGGEAASQLADDGAGRVDVDIHAGGEVEVDACLAEFLSDDGGVAGHAVVAPFGGGLGGHGGGEAVAGAHTGHVAAFLVDADKQVAVGVLLQVGAERLELVGRQDVAVAGAGGSVVFKKDDAAYMVLLYVADDVVVGLEGGAAEPHKEHLADVLQQLVFLFHWLCSGLGCRLDVLATGGEGECREHKDEKRTFHVG